MLAQSSLGRDEYLKHMGNRFSQPAPDVGWSILWVFALLACLVFVVWVLAWWQRRRSRPAQGQPIRLYLKVAGAAGLSLPARWRLWQLARVTNLQHPTSLLIARHRFDEAVKLYCGTQGLLGSRAAAAPRFAEIRRHLFETEQEPASPR